MDSVSCAHDNFCVVGGSFRDARYRITQAFLATATVPYSVTPKAQPGAPPPPLPRERPVGIGDRDVRNVRLPCAGIGRRSPSRLDAM